MTEILIFDFAGVMGRLDQDEALFRELLQVFREEYPKLDAALVQAVSGGEAPLVTLHAHSLKGALGNVGAARASDAAKLLEFASRRGEAAQYQSLLGTLRNEVEQYLEEIKKSGY
ncbi:MAG: Hpt domain-containing protein [Proteobacteria bacterium]|nr:Hpt domain-containing protein [Pseudomonadota bacterium]